MKVPIKFIADEPCGCRMNACCGQCLAEERRRLRTVSWLATAVLVVLALMALSMTNRYLTAAIHNLVGVGFQTHNSQKGERYVAIALRSNGSRHDRRLRQHV